MDEYVDIDHEVSEIFYELLDIYEEGNVDEIKSKLNQLIEEDPYFLDSYLLMYEILMNEDKEEEAIKYLDNAYNKAVETITIGDKWPYRLEWDWIENRHIIRAILNKGIYLWANGKENEAIEIFRRLLKMNPADQIGARFYILAIRKGISFEDFEERFSKDGEYGDSLFQWFNENYQQYMDEFKEWDDEMRALGVL